jgi:metallo-beta-lactamase class B
MRTRLLLVVLGSALVSAQSPYLSPAQRAQFHGPYSEAVEPFRVVGNIHYVGAKNIASYLLTTPDGHILIDTGTKEMEPVVRANIEKLGVKLQDIKILLSGHAHFDHVQGHAAMKKATGARVMAIGGDAAALSSGTDNSALGDEGWEPVQVDRVLKDGDTVSLGGTTLRAVWTPGHTQGATLWLTTVEEQGKRSTVAFVGGTLPNAGVPLFNNPRHPNVVADTERTLRVLKEMKPPDIYLIEHPQAMFASPHRFGDAEGWTQMVATADANFQKMLKDAQDKEKPASR